MSVDKEKNFVIKHTFTGFKNLKKDVRYFSEEERYFSIPWSIYIYPHSSSLVNVFLKCLKLDEGKAWSIDTTVETKILTKTGENVVKKNLNFSKGIKNALLIWNEAAPVDQFNDNISIECHVTINKVTGIEIPVILRSFDDESAKKFSDVVLKVKDQKFYVNKMYLAAQSTYFESLLLGNFEESKQAEVELKDIDPYDFQKFLEVLYASPDINDGTVEGILKLADMYDAEAVIGQCETFLMKDSKKNLKDKFLLAIQYKLENLKKKCMPEFNTCEDIRAIIPVDATQFDSEVWKELLNLALDFKK